MKEGNAQQTRYVCQLPVQKFKIVKEEEEGKFAQILFQKGELKFFQPTNKGAFFSYYDGEHYYLKKLTEKKEPHTLKENEDFLDALMNYDPTKDLICQVDTLIKSKTPIRPLTLEILLTTITDNYVFYDIEQEKKEVIKIQKMFTENYPGLDYQGFFESLDIFSQEGKELPFCIRLYNYQGFYGIMSLQKKNLFHMRPFIYSEQKEQIYQISDKEDFVSPSQYWTALIKLEEIKKALEKYQGNGERKKQALQYIKKYKTNKK